MTSKMLKPTSGLVSLAVLLTASTQASVITVNASATALLQDNDLDGFGDNLNPNEGFPAYGSFGGNFGIFNVAGGFAFTLPALPLGEVFQSATFRAFFDGSNGQVPGGTDLFGIRVDASSAFANSDYGIGSGQSGVLLGNDLTVNAGSYIVPIDVTSFIGVGYTAGNTAFFRISADASTADVNTAGVREFFQGFGQSNPPQLEITTTVPEPASLGLLALSTVGLAMMRRRRSL